MKHKLLMDKLIFEVSKGYIGNGKVVKDLVLAMVSGLHVLIEDVSGVGKTTLVKSLAKASGLSFGRIQFTPDLLPGDITGMSIWDPIKREFVFKEGSIFNQFILGDEINRASPRTQSALLEAMEENTVSVDGKTILLPEPFCVVATKNPSFYKGTFDLPESQLDRFGVLLKPGYPSKENEKTIINKFKDNKSLDSVNCITNNKELIELKKIISSVIIDDKILEYIVNIGNITRNNPDIKYGISTRGIQHLLKLSQSIAIYNNRDFIIPEDIIYSSNLVIPHKIELSSNAILSDSTDINIVKKLISNIEIPIGIR